MTEMNDLIQTLRDAGEHDRDPETGDGPLRFCLEAADTIEQLRAELAKTIAWGEDFFGPHRWRNAGDLHSENHPAPGPALHKLRSDLIEYGYGIVDEHTHRVHDAARSSSRRAAERDAGYYGSVENRYYGSGSHYEVVTRLAGVDGADWETID